MATSKAATPTQVNCTKLGDDNKSKLLCPHALCHVVLRTVPETFDRLIDFYLTVLGGHVSHRSHRLCFMTYDHEHHRIAIIKDTTAISRVSGAAPPVGLHHIAFGFATLADLVTSYLEKKDAGIFPVWCVNHGVTTSMYYQDPDGNQIEFQVDNFGTNQEAADFMESAAFAENPVGVDFDPEVFVRRLQGGEDEASIKKRPNIGPRDRV